MQLLSVGGFLMQAIKAINDKIYKDDRCAHNSPIWIEAWKNNERVGLCLRMHTVGPSAPAVIVIVHDESLSVLS